MGQADQRAAAEKAAEKIWNLLAERTQFPKQSEIRDIIASCYQPQQEVVQWAQAVLTAWNTGDLHKESLLHKKLREVMINYRKEGDATCPNQLEKHSKSTNEDILESAGSAAPEKSKPSQESGSPTKLLPCPFCGSRNIRTLTREDGIHTTCCGCGGEIVRPILEESVAAWNKRAPSTPEAVTDK